MAGPEPAPRRRVARGLPAAGTAGAAGTARAAWAARAALPTALLALLLVAQPLALPAGAHGPLPERLFDPITRDLPGWLGPDGAVADAAPADGFAAFDAALGATPALAWSRTVPVATRVLGGFAVNLVFRADTVVLPRVPDRALLEVATLLAGQPVEGSAVILAAPEVPLMPDKAYALTARAGDQPFDAAAGDALGLRVTLLGTLARGQAGLVLGAAGSVANASAQVQDLDALGHDHPGWRHVTPDAFETLRVTTDRVWDVDFRHGPQESTTQAAEQGSTIALRLDNAESPEQGAAHGPWGLDAPHRLRLTGPGLDLAFGLYPSEVLLRDLTLDQPGTWALSCESGCTRAGPFAHLEVRAAGAGPGVGQGDDVTLEPGQLYEVNVQLDQGEPMRWDYATEPAQALHYDVHSHRGAEVVVHDEGDGAARNGTFAPDDAGVYSLLLENRGGAPVHVAYHVAGGTPYEPPAQRGLPLPAWLGLAGLALGALALGWRRG